MLDLTTEKILEFLNSFPFFQDFTDSEKKKFAHLKSSVIYSANGENIITEGDFDLSLFILLKGSAVVTKKNRPSAVIAKLSKGAIFGEMAFLSKGPRTANVISTGDTYSLKIDGEMFERLNLSLQNKFSAKLIELMVQRLNRANDLVSQFINRI